MRRTIAVVAVLLAPFLAPGIAAQTVSNVMRPNVPSPTAASLGKFGDVPVAYYTGLPQISIPLFTAKGKTLELPVSLSYHASGIKLEEIGGWVGMGWALEAGGVITRTVHGIVDEQPEGYFNTGRTLYDPANWTNPPPPTYFDQIHDLKSIDTDPDQFFFNFAGQAGEMVGGDTTADPANTLANNVYVTIPYRKWRIVPTFGTDPYWGYGSIVSWAITTEDGTKYTFAAPEVHVDKTMQWLGEAGHSSKPYVSAWYLTEIRSPGGDVITLQYADYTAEHHTGMYREEATNISEFIPGDCHIAGYSEGTSKIFDLHSQTYVHAKRLLSITSAAHIITFAHSLRDDARSPEYGDFISGRLQQEPKLDLMTISTPGGVVLRKFEFEYTYAGSLGGRLTLLNVYEEDASGNRLPPYSFTYDGPTLPARVYDYTDYHNPPRTASFALDHWGYYNGATTNTTVIPPGTAANGTSYPGANRNPDFNYMKAGVLTKITYPTGGFNEFIHEANDYSTGGQLLSDPIPHNASAGTTGTGQRTTDFTVGGVDPTDNGHLTIYVSEACGVTPCPFVQLFDNGQLISTWTRDGSEPASIDIPWVFTRDHTYTLIASTAGHNITAIAISAYWSERVALPSKKGAGLRIAQIHADDGMGHVTVRKYSYVLGDGRSSGWLAADPKYDYDRSPPPAENGCTYYSRSSSPRNSLGDGPVVGYSLVTESLGATGEFGSTTRTMAAGCDCAAAAQARNGSRVWPALRYTTEGWRRGQELGTTDYSAGGQPQRDVASTYGIPPSPYPQIEFRGLAVDVSSMWGTWSSSVTYANQFYVRTGLKVQTDQWTTLYDTTGTSNFATHRHFVYGNPNHAQLTEITENNSDGTQRITRLKYPGDYATGGPAGSEAAALTAMQDVSVTGAHMPGVVIERSVSVKTGASDRVAQAEITTFKEFATGQFLPFKHYVFNSPSPVP
jgi:hypothetical protein